VRRGQKEFKREMFFLESFEMKIAIHLTIIVAITISTVSHSAEAGRKDNRQPLTFCNPLNIEYRFTPGKPSRRMAADPVIVLFRDTYFLFSTGSSEYWHSSDLVNWILIPEEKSESHSA